MPKKLEFKPADLTKEVVAEERSNSRVAVQEAYSVRRHVQCTFTKLHLCRRERLNPHPFSAFSKIESARRVTSPIWGPPPLCRQALTWDETRSSFSLTNFYFSINTGILFVLSKGPFLSFWSN